MRYLVIALAVIAITAHDARAGSAGGSSSSFGVGYDQQRQQGSSTGGNATSNSNASAGASSSSGSKSSSNSNANGTNTVTQVYQGGGSSTIHNTPDAVPSTIYGGTNPCAVGASAAMSVAGLGIGGGGMWNSPGCERRNGAVILFQANLPDVAIALLCQDDEMRTAFRQAGRPCPADRAQVASAEPAPAPMAVAAPMPVAAGPAPEAMPEASNSGGPRSRPAWCESTNAPRPSDHGPDATAYRFYCQ